MFKDIKSALSELQSRTSSSMFELSHFQRCMADLNNPQNQLKCIHIAGTNGKGSTSNFIRSVLENAGYKVGLYTSPYLISHNDRIRINNQPIDDERLLGYINQSYPLWETYQLSMFEIDTLIAIWYYVDEQVDWAIFEVGLGGRLDATNVIYGVANVITTIGMDHMEFLGNTLEKIAYEKAGIIKERSLVILGEDKPEPLNAIIKHCHSFQIEPIMRQEIDNITQKENGFEFSYQQQTYSIQGMALYQINNASLAIETCNALKKVGHVKFTEDQLYHGIAQAKWLGRFEQVKKSPLTFIDGAHNEHGILALVQTLKFCPRPLIVVFTALKDKETSKMLSHLIGIADQVIVTEFDFIRAEKAIILAKGFDVLIEPNWQKALQLAQKQAKTEGCVVITGSLYFISEVRRYIMNTLLEKKG